MRYKIVAKVALYPTGEDEFDIGYVLVDEQCNTQTYFEKDVRRMVKNIDNIRITDNKIGIVGVADKMIPQFDMRGINTNNPATILGVSQNGQNYMVLLPDGNTLIIDANDLYTRCKQSGLRLSNAKIVSGKFYPKAGTFFKF